MYLLLYEGGQKCAIIFQHNWILPLLRRCGRHYRFTSDISLQSHTFFYKNLRTEIYVRNCYWLNINVILLCGHLIYKALAFIYSCKNFYITQKPLQRNYNPETYNLETYSIHIFFIRNTFIRNLKLKKEFLRNLPGWNKSSNLRNTKELSFW